MGVKVRWNDRQGGRVYYLDIIHDGRRKKVKIPVSSLKEAKEAAAKIERELLADGWGSKGFQISLREFASEYLADSHRKKAYNTFRTDRDALAAFQRFVGETRLAQITEDDFERFRTERLGRVKPSSVNVALRHLRAAFSWAYRKGYVSTNPAAKVKLMRVPKNTHIRYLNKAEITRLREAIGDNVALRRVVDLALWTGLRRNELVHLQWADISFEQLTITVQNKEEEGFRTKSGKSRVVPINAPLAAMLRELHGVPHTATDRVLNVNYWTVGNHFREAAKRAGLGSHLTLHILRHSFASHLIMAGVDLRSVQEMLGHHDVSVTMIYSHLSPGHLAKTVEKLPY
jgi:site-specific recombinase XerD